jgi:hypothetical protein
VLQESIEVDPPFELDATASTPSEIVKGQVIRAKLRPGGRDPDTRFSMFGTDRTIQSFHLEINAITEPGQQESCSAVGIVSYTAEVDFRDETEEDCLYFTLYLKPETFAHYAAKIAQGSVDEMEFSVGSVAGFYSGWSPGISTDHVKVLAAGKEQTVEVPEGCEIRPPRLGKVDKFELYFTRRLEFDEPTSELELVEDMADIETGGTASETPPPTVASPQMLEMLGSLKLAAWFVVGLLALILFFK